MMNSLKNLIFNLLITWNRYYLLVKQERAFEVPISKRLKMYRRGFRADQWVTYDFQSNNMSDYLSDIECAKAGALSGKYSFIMNNKIVFTEVFNQYVKVPQIFAWVKGGTLLKTSKDLESINDIIDILNRNNVIVTKPISDHSGKGFQIIRKVKNGEYLINSSSISEVQLKSNILQQDDCIISEFVKQHEYSSKIFPDTTNTIRVISIIDPRSNKVKIPYAFHRFGSKTSFPVDNAANGGLIAFIDTETGEMSDAKSLKSKISYSKHPDSNEPIQGVEIPHWNMIKKTLLEVAEKVPYLRMIGWDVVVTNDGFYVLEVNRVPSFAILQVNGGIRHSEFGEILRCYGVLK